jgi:hypothetical protein
MEDRKRGELSHWRMQIHADAEQKEEDPCGSTALYFKGLGCLRTPDPQIVLCIQREICISLRQRVVCKPTLKEACSGREVQSAICVQRFDDSLNSAIRITYRISLRSSSLREPRHPLLTVVLGFLYLHGFLLCKIKILVDWFGLWV